MPKSLARAALAAALVLPGIAWGADFEWKFFTYFPTNDKPAQQNRAFAEDVLKASGGRLKITVLAAGELPYKAPDVVKAVATNQVQIGDVAVGFAAGDVPELNVFGMPFLCTSYPEFVKAMAAVRQPADEIFKRKFNITPAIHWTMPPQNLWLNRPVQALDELKGLKIRSWNPEQVEMLKPFGASAVSITSAEVIPALERKVIDGAITSALSASDWKAYEIIKTGLMVNFTMGHQVLLINNDQLGKLPQDLRELLLAKAREWEPKYNAMSEDGDREARQNLQQHGVALRQLSAADMQRAKQAMVPLWEGWAAKNGAPAQQMLQSVKGNCSGA